MVVGEEFYRLAIDGFGGECERECDDAHRTRRAPRDARCGHRAMCKITEQKWPVSSVGGKEY